MGRTSLLSAVCALFLLFAVSEAHGATIAAGLSHTLAIKADGTLWAWGDNTSGELGRTARHRRQHPAFPTGG